MKLQHKFVRLIPNVIEQGVLYISIEYCTIIHKCICGCNNEVVTPISPTDWKIVFDGETISLSPSIGNWNFDCKSHYWIIHNEIRLARRWNKDEIAKSKKHDQKIKKDYFSQRKNITG